MGELLDAWLTYIESIGRALSTLRSHRSKVETRIRPALGATKLRKLGPEDLDRFYAAQMQDGPAANTVLQTHRILSAALHQAEVDPPNERHPPPAPMRELKCPTPAQVNDIAAAARRSRQPSRANLIDFIAMTGIRRGEACALQWSDVDPADDAGFFIVRRTVDEKAPSC